MLKEKGISPHDFARLMKRPKAVTDSWLTEGAASGTPPYQRLRTPLTADWFKTWNNALKVNSVEELRKDSSRPHSIHSIRGIVKYAL